jgi:hypothetical protein
MAQIGPTMSCVLQHIANDMDPRVSKQRAESGYSGKGVVDTVGIDRRWTQEAGRDQAVSNP